MTGKDKRTHLVAGWVIGLLLIATGLQAQANVAPHQVLAGVSERMFDTLQRERELIREKPAHLFTVVEQVLVPHVEINVMSRFVLGQHWRRANDQQKERFAEEFKNLLVRFYVSALLEDSRQLDNLLANKDNLVRFQSSNVADDSRTTTVRGEVNLPGGPRVPLGFSMMRVDSGEWLMYDLNVDGISLVANYRTSFSNDINREGLDALIARLAQRNQELLDRVNGKTTSN